MPTSTDCGPINTCIEDQDCAGGETCTGVGMDDVIIVRARDSALISFPIDSSPAP